MSQFLKIFIIDPTIEYDIDLRRKGQYYSRLLAIEKQIADQKNEFTPIIKQNNLDPISSQENYPKSLICNILLSQLPSISESASIEKLVKFKSDEDVKIKFLALRNFINELVKKNLNFIEVEDKIEYLIKEYESQLKLHTKTCIVYFGSYSNCDF